MNDKEPEIGDRKSVWHQGKMHDMVWMPDPWAWNVTFCCWCSVEALERDNIEVPK